MDKEQFWKLVNECEEHGKKQKQQEEEIGVYWSEDGKYFVWNYYDKQYIFDMQDYNAFMEIWHNKLLCVNKDDYLCVKDKDSGQIWGVHRELKMKEVEQLAQKLNCVLGDIHVHHNHLEKFDNTGENLKIFHKDMHAVAHGFRCWAEYEDWLLKHGKRDYH